MRVPVELLIERYKDNLYAAAYNICRSPADSEDVVQETFLQYHFSSKDFESEQHIRAWLLRVAINRAKNITRSFWNRNKVDLEDYMESLTFETPQAEDLFETVMKLPEQYRIVTHLFYYEDQSVREIAGTLGVSENNVKVRLTRARQMLKLQLGEEWKDD